MCNFDFDGVDFTVPHGTVVEIMNNKLFIQTKLVQNTKVIDVNKKGYVLEQVKKFGEIGVSKVITAGSDKSIYSAFKSLQWKASIKSLGDGLFETTRIS